MPKKTFENAEAAGAIFITQAKNNQKTLHKQLAYGCGLQQPVTVHHDVVTKHHGRIERRTYEVFETEKILKKWPEWKNIRSVIRVTRMRTEAHPPYKESEGVFYYVSNRVLPASEVADYIRQHWLIENKLHHVRDRSFLEDKTIKRQNPAVFATMISFAFNMLRVKNVQNINNTLYVNSLNLLDMLESIHDL